MDKDTKYRGIIKEEKFIGILGDIIFQFFLFVTHVKFKKINKIY